MKKITMTLSTLMLSAASISLYAESNRHISHARVTEVTPIYRTIEQRVPTEECWVETVREETPQHAHRSATGTIVGGIIGGALGNAVGHGKSNKKVGAVVGSILGMSIGNDISRQHRHHEGYRVSYRDEQRCETRYLARTEQQLVGYDVTYKFRGRTYTTHMDRDPGDKIKVEVSVVPLGY